MSLHCQNGFDTSIFSFYARINFVIFYFSDTNYIIANYYFSKSMMKKDQFDMISTNFMLKDKSLTECRGCGGNAPSVLQRSTFFAQ